MLSPSEESHHAWLHDKLDGWLNDGMITPEATARLRERYPKADATAHGVRAANWIMVLFGIIGSALIGGGIILLLAHNWEQMSRPVRVALAFTPLVLSQATGFWMLLKNTGGVWGREAVGTFIALMAGACIALISQTYNLGGDFSQFMLVWTLLSLPVAYLLRTTLPAIWFCAATVIWICSLNWRTRGIELWFWPLLALVLPLWWMELRRDRYHPRTVLLTWAIAIAGCVGVVACSETGSTSDFWMLSTGGWFAFLYLAGLRWFGEDKSLWRRPLQFIGIIGATVIALILTFDRAWDHTLYNPTTVASSGQRVADCIFTFGWAVLALLLWVERLIRRDIVASAVGSLPFLILAAMALSNEGIAHALFNTYVFATGVMLLIVGIHTRKLGTVNYGISMITALIICRFFQSDMSLVLRGVVFILLGMGFLVTNFTLLRRKGTVS